MGGRLLHRIWDLEAAPLAQTLQPHERPVEDARPLPLDRALHRRIPLFFWDAFEVEHLHAPEEAVARAPYPGQLVHRPRNLRPRNEDERVSVLLLHLYGLARDQGIQDVAGPQVSCGLLGGGKQRLARDVGESEAVALDLGETEQSGPRTEHRPEPGQKRAPTTSRRAVQPEGKLVGGVGGEGVAGELLQEGRYVITRYLPEKSLPGGCLRRRVVLVGD